MKRFLRSMLVLAGVGAAVCAALWLLRERISGPPVEPVRSHDQAPRLRTPPTGTPTPAATGSDDLSEISGIGPVYKRRLADAGIATFAALAAADPETVADTVGAPAAFVEDWVGQAAARA
ncbi:MAG: helix-hairpin-helix domain-containing protein [Acidimicrobiia bacterium]|nr:helix-hairpin-helix domain-containing protein [Acidimicrobiia bacterium]